VKNIIISLLLALIVIDIPAYGEENRSDGVSVTAPAGMETIKEGDVNLVVYKGRRMRKQGDVNIPETPDEYASRKFTDADDRFRKIEKALEAQRKSIEDLMGLVKKLEENGQKK
jgi:hypothetical protein